jgi:hypothetical protein
MVRKLRLHQMDKWRTLNKKLLLNLWENKI